MDDKFVRRFFEGLYVPSFRRGLVTRLGGLVHWDMALVVPAGPLGDDIPEHAVALAYDRHLFEHYLDNRHRYYPSMWPLFRALRKTTVVDSFGVLGRSVVGMDIYREVNAPSGVISQLHALLSFRGHATCALSLKRRSGAFRPRDLQQLSALLPMMSALDAALVTRCAPSATDDAEFVSLSPREREVCGLVRLGLQNKEIAAMLGTSLDTVRKQTISIYRKLGLHGRAGLLIRTPGAALGSKSAQPHAVRRVQRGPNGPL